MTKRELRQLYNLKREIAQDYKRLEDLKDLALRCTSGIDGQPHGAGSGDRMANVIADITDLEAEITEQIVAYAHEYDRLNTYLDTVDDSFIRQIIKLRYVDGLMWFQVAHEIGGNNTDNSVRKALDRYLDKN